MDFSEEDISSIRTKKKELDVKEILNKKNLTDFELDLIMNDL